MQSAFEVDLVIALKQERAGEEGCLLATPLCSWATFTGWVPEEREKENIIKLHCFFASFFHLA